MCLGSFALYKAKMVFIFRTQMDAYKKLKKKLCCFILLSYCVSSYNVVEASSNSNQAYDQCSYQIENFPTSIESLKGYAEKFTPLGHTLLKDDSQTSFSSFLHQQGVIASNEIRIDSRQKVSKCDVASSIYDVETHFLGPHNHLIIDENRRKSQIITHSFTTHGLKNKTLRGPCPLFHALDNSKFQDLNLICTNANMPAIEIKGKNVQLLNVNVPENHFLARAIDNYHLEVGDLVIENSRGVVVFANIASGTITVRCEPNKQFDTLVVTQRVGSNLGSTSCSYVSLDAVLSPLGTQYEIDYLYRNAEVTPYNQFFRWGLILYGTILIALILYTFITREKEIRLIIMGARYDKIMTVLNLFDSSSEGT